MFEDIEPPKEQKGNVKIRYWHDIKSWWSGLNRNVRFGIISMALLCFAAAALTYYSLTYPNSEPDLIITKSQKPKPTTVASPLTGLQVEPEQAKRPVTGIIIENSLDARPQSGIQQAGVVFEAIAEGGITRFLTLYQEARPQYIGPVRSLRPYYIDWAKSFDAPIAHVGGSPTALRQIRSGGKDLDQFFNPGAYWRQSTRAAPHNVYTSFKGLDKLNKAKKYKSSKFTPWARKADSPLETPTAITINVNISSFNFNSSYKYDKETNSYYRSQGGRGHVATKSPNDRKPKRLHPKVVIVLVMSYGIASDGQHSVYDTTGKGTALIFQDGNVKSATWRKPGRSSPISFVNSEGKIIELNAGQAWVVAVAAKNRVTYSAPKPPASDSQ